jgi:hypothetical protein
MRPQRWLLLAAVVLYLLSLWLPAVTGQGFPEQSGMDLLRQGSGSWRNGIFAWYANPALWIAIVTAWFGMHRAALAAAAAGLVLGLSSFAAAGIAVRAGRSVPEFAYVSGFYVWLVALAVAVAASLFGIYKVSAPRAARVPESQRPARD